MTSPAAPASAELTAAYRSQRARLANVVAAATARAFTQFESDRAAALRTVIPIVEAGQHRTVALVEAYMSARALEVTGSRIIVPLDPSRYSISALRNGVAAGEVYGRPFGALFAFQRTEDQRQAMAGAHAALDKLVRTDLQLAQTHAARDWMAGQAATATTETRIVGWRRVTDGDPCPLCAKAATRTYRTGDLMPIHEHCGCTVEPLWGQHSVASIGTTVRVENDPEIGPRLMADTWSNVGPRLL